MIYSWKEWVHNEATKPYLQKILGTVKAERNKYKVFPVHDNVFRSFTLCPVDKIKVLIIGQDPYPQYGIADGLAFSTPKKGYIPATLQIIYKEIQRSLYPKQEQKELFSSADLSWWAKQGVLLFNTSLTVREGQSNSHAELWRPFTMKVVQLISLLERPIVVMFWGRQAQDYRDFFEKNLYVKNKFKLSSVHPVAEARGSGKFTGSDHFLLCNNWLEKYYGEGQGIDWRIPEEEPFPIEWMNFEPLN